jgi:hypothetical protein
MTSNDLIVLDRVLADELKQSGLSLEDDKFFELFSGEQVLKEFELDIDEIRAGIIGGSNDGGIDGVWAFLDGDLVDEDTDFSGTRKGPRFQLIILQAKTAQSFGETSIQKIHISFGDLFSLGGNDADLGTKYNSALVSRCGIAKRAFLALQTKFPIIEVKIIYATKGETASVHPKVSERSKDLKQLVETLLSGSRCQVSLIGSSELLVAYRRQKTNVLQLRCVESPLSRGDNNYVALSSLEEFYNFVKDENGNIRRYLFESNVRDYQGKVEVNRDIQSTLQSSSQTDFWWLNNGVTVLATDAKVAGKTITLENVQIVNGLQTTREIYNYLDAKSESGEQDKRRSVLVRVIVTKLPELAEEIVKATNSQTSIPRFSLRATDKIQKDIETYLGSYGYYYDRRKNYYLNLGRPADKIITIPYLAQAIMAIVLKEPDTARARPSSLIKKETDYERVFDPNLNPQVFLFCVELMRRVETILVDKKLPLPDWFPNTNARFHIAYYLVAKTAGRAEYTTQDIQRMFGHRFTDAELGESRVVVRRELDVFRTKMDWTEDRTVKSSQFVDHLKGLVS